VAAGVAGEVDAVMAGVGESGAAAKDGRLRILAVMAPERVASQPNVPTGKELGVDLVIGGWGMIGAPKGLPENVRQRLVESLTKAAGSPTFKDVMAKAGNTPLLTSTAEAEAFAKAEFERFGAIYKK
jgi:tripartite-type tricarboxylate transporter receptor subunit TctC